MSFKVMPGLRDNQYSVRLTHCGYVISLAWDQSQTAVWEDDNTDRLPIRHTINGASAETIREAMAWIEDNT